MKGWYSVRSVFRCHHTVDGELRRAFEERVVLFQAAGFEAALAKAEAEANRYLAVFDASMRCRMLDHLVAYYIHSDKALRDGDEVWSCVREMETTDDQFLEKVFEGETASFTNVHRQTPAA